MSDCIDHSGDAEFSRYDDTPSVHREHALKTTARGMWFEKRMDNWKCSCGLMHPVTHSMCFTCKDYQN